MEMPCLIPAELSAWMEDLQKDMQEGLNTGDHSRVIELSSMLTMGVERMVEMTRQEISDDEFLVSHGPRRGRFAPYRALPGMDIVAHVWEKPDILGEFAD